MLTFFEMIVTTFDKRVLLPLKEWLKEEYIKTESTREWEQFRMQIVNSCLRENQIFPGTGKWHKPASQTEEAKVLCQK